MGEKPPHRRESRILVLGVDIVDEGGLQELLFPVAQILLPPGVHPLQPPLPVDQAEKIQAPLEEEVQLSPLRCRKVLRAPPFPTHLSQEEDPDRRSLPLRRGVVPPEEDRSPPLGHRLGFETLLGRLLTLQPQESGETLVLPLREEKLQGVSPQDLRRGPPEELLGGAVPLNEPSSPFVQLPRDEGQGRRRQPRQRLSILSLLHSRLPKGPLV